MLGKFEREVKTLSLYLSGWTQEMIAEEVEGDQSTVTRALDRMQNGQMTEMHTILTKEDPDDDTKARQSIIKRYLGAHLLDPTLDVCRLRSIESNRS